MKISNLSALPRPIDPQYPTNLAIAGLTALVTVAAAIVRLLLGSGWLDGVLWAAQLGLAVFLTWALSRELDPDHAWSAFVGAVLTIPAVGLVGLPGLSAALWALVALRIVNRSTGLAARILDSLVLFVLGAWVTWQGMWPLGLATALAFFLDGVLVPRLPRQLLFAAITLAVTLILIQVKGLLAPAGPFSTTGLVLVAVATLLFLIAILTSRTVRSVGDITHIPLNPQRVQAAQVVGLAAVLGVTALMGDRGAVLVLPLWLAILGVGLFRVMLLVVGRLRA